MTDNIPSEKILNKIKNLLTLANGTKNVHEASVAFEKAQKLLLEYNLNPEHIEGVAEELGLGEIVELPCIFPKPDLKNKVVWFSHLCNKLATLNLCEMYNNKGLYKSQTGSYRANNEVRIIGRKENVETLIYMINNLTIQLLELCERDWKLYKAAGGNVHGRMWKNAWFISAVSQVIHNVASNYRKFENNPAGAALIISRNNELQKYVDDNLKLRNSPKAVYHLIESAVDAGTKAGSSINVQKAAPGAISNPLYLE